MAAPRRFLDVHIVETNTVYKDVPFSVVTDWVQQGRLLEDDRLRPKGTTEWLKVGAMPDFSPYLPKVEPFRANDQAEALEPVQMDFAWKKGHGDEDEDVDMIPLIDISLVLLIFFMMTAAVGGAGTIFETPQAENKLIAVTSDMWWIGIKPGPEEQPVYFLGKGDTGPEEEFHSQKEVAEALEAKLAQEPAAVTIRIRGHRKVPYELIRDMVAGLGDVKQRTNKINNILAEVSEKENR